MNSTTAEHLVVLGGGYIVLEFARCPPVRKPRNDHSACGQLLAVKTRMLPMLCQVMEEDGIKVLLNTEAVRVRRRKQIELIVRSSERNRR